MTTTAAPVHSSGRTAYRTAAAAYRRMTKRRMLLLVALAVALLGAVALDIAWGPTRLSLIEVVKGVIAPDSVNARSHVIIWDIRMPVGLMAVLVGASLSVAGAEMQTILNNPLASPFTLGISAAAGFGAALAIVMGVSILPIAGNLFITLNAFIFAMLASLLVYGFSKMRGVSTESMVLVGIALVFLFSSLLALLQYIASEQALQQIVFWTMGSLARTTWGKVGVAALVLAVTMPYFFTQSWKLTALRLGEEKAHSLGINTQRLRLHNLIAVSILASVSVAFVGTVGFVGLVGPHVARMLVGEDQRSFLPASALAGALLMSATSIASKSIVPGVLVPIGIITSLVGIPFFLSLILTKRRQLW
jgi:iron complex transport system permease protein